MNELTKVIEHATSRVGPGYFHLEIDGGSPVYRERVYCYELYHQMRLCWPKHTKFSLNGEVDKSAHPILRELLGSRRPKPDLLVHQPGYMSGNYAIIEVKSQKAENRGIRKDLETLSLFIDKAGYQRAIYLIFGFEAAAVAKRIICAAGRIQGLKAIELWLHERPCEPAMHYTTLCNEHR